MSNLEKQIAAALTGKIELDALDKLIRATEQAIFAVEEEAEAEYERSFDIVAAPDGKAAREAAAATAFAVERLRTALPDLQARYKQIADAERREQWRARRAPLAAERDQLAGEFAEYYPRVERDLPDLLERIARNDRAIAALQDDAPDNSSAEFLLGAELKARGLTAFSRDAPSITKAMRLPRFAADAHLAWPPDLPWNRGLL